MILRTIWKKCLLLLSETGGNGNKLKATWKKDALFTMKKYDLIPNLVKMAVFFQASVT